MRQLPNYLLWIAQGREISQPDGWKGRALEDDRYYVTHGFNASMGIALRVAAGPFETESQACAEAHAMTDTSGT